MNLKSERLKKLESELADLEQWLKLGLVPKKDIEKHQAEIEAIEKKINEEVMRLRFLKESGEVEEYTPPKRGARPAYQEPQSMPDVTVAEGSSTTEEGSFEGETESFEGETQTEEETSETSDSEMNSQFYDEDEDPFSDRNRWKRGVLEDFDADQW
jgi:hypothetical protein